MNFRHTVCSFSLAVLGVLAFDGTAVGAEKPNILLIMSDDHTVTGIGAYGGRFASLDPTPHIDRLAREGVLMSNCFCTNSICVPSRATILTGQYSHVNGIKTLSYALESEYQSLPKEMKRAGYETAIIGKWHLAAEPAAFDHYCVLPGQGFYFNPTFRVRGPKPWPKNEFRFNQYDSVHSSDAITNLSLKWLKGRQSEKPFFLMHHFKAPHDNFENAERYDWLYEDVEMPEPKSLRQRGNHGPLGRERYGTSVSRRNTRRNMGHHMFVPEDLSDEDYTTESYQRYMKKFFRAVRGVDDNIGRLLDYLENSGQLDDTIIVYTADQGFMLGEHDYIDKRWVYEESLRMPWIIRYPKKFPAGTVVDDIVNNVDFAPTLLELAGDDRAVDGWQGRSFVKNLEGETPADWPTASYYRYWMHMAHHDNPAHYGIRTTDYKLIFFYGLPLDAVGAKPTPTAAHWELYDLQKDPHEMNNVYADPDYSAVVARLKEELRALKAAVGDTDGQYPDLLRRVATQ